MIDYQINKDKDFLSESQIVMKRISDAKKIKVGDNFSLFLSALKNYYEKEKISTELPDSTFLEWLIGFTEGDGCFFCNNRGECSVIWVQGIANIDLLKKIQQKLSFGNIIKQGKRVLRLIVQRQDQVELLILLFNGNLVLPTKKEQFRRFLFAFQKKRQKAVAYEDNGKKKYEFDYKNEKNMPSLESAWLLGFVEAEGCFTISFLSNSQAFRTRFIISQKGDQNIPILSRLLLLFGAGTLEGHSAKENYSYILSGLKSISKIYPYFDKNIKHFVGIKKMSYLAFKECNQKIQNKEHLCKKKRHLLSKLAKQINSIPRKAK